MYRIATLEDTKAILAFGRELKHQNARMSFTEYDTIDYIKDQLSDENIRVFIGLDQGQVVAMFRGIRGTGLKDHSVYVACAIKKDYRKKGLATGITNFALDYFKDQGILIARTKIYSWNKASIATIKKCGFQESGRVVMHEFLPDINDYIDDVIFHRKL